MLNQAAHLSSAQEQSPMATTLPHAKSTFDTAYSLIGGDRKQAYGNYTTEATHVANIWNSLLKGGPVLARHVPLMMICLKVLRESNQHKPDNMIDVCGYAGLSAELEATLNARSTEGAS